MARSLQVAILTLVSSLAVPVARADVLVLKDGSRVVTAGAWEVKGAAVVFRDAQGRLSSLQSKQVDLEASQRATREAEAAAVHRSVPARTQPAPQAVLTLTDADVAHVTPDQAASGEPGETADKEPEEAGRVAVTGWAKQVDPKAEEVVVTGTVRNTSDATVGTLRVLIDLFDGDGNELASLTTDVQPAALPPRASGRFRVQVPGLTDFDDARIRVESVALQTAPPRPAVVPQQVYEQRQRTTSEPED